MQEIGVRSLGQEDPLEKEMATHSSILAWEIPWTEESGELQSMGSQRIGHDWAHTYAGRHPGEGFITVPLKIKKKKKPTNLLSSKTEIT